jgi:hypothetical protein
VPTKIPRRYYANVGPLPILYVRLIRSAEAGGLEGQAGALHAFGSLALVNVPKVGVLPSRSTIDSDDTYQRIQDIAARYLGLEDAEERLSREWPRSRQSTARRFCRCSTKCGRSEILRITSTASV